MLLKQDVMTEICDAVSKNKLLCVSVCLSYAGGMAGQIIARGENTWLVRIYVGRDETGTRKYLNKTIHGTKKDAQRWLTATLRDQDMGLSVQPRQGILNDYLDRWLESCAKPKVRTKTFAGYQEVLNRYVRPKLGARPLAKLSPLEI